MGPRRIEHDWATETTNHEALRYQCFLCLHTLGKTRFCAIRGLHSSENGLWAGASLHCHEQMACQMTLIPGNTCIWGRGRVPHLPNRGFSPGRMRDDLVTVLGNFFLELLYGQTSRLPPSPRVEAWRCWLWPTGKSSSPGSRHTPLPQTGLPGKARPPPMCVVPVSRVSPGLEQTHPQPGHTLHPWLTQGSVCSPHGCSPNVLRTTVLGAQAVSQSQACCSHELAHRLLTLTHSHTHTHPNSGPHPQTCSWMPTQPHTGAHPISASTSTLTAPLALTVAHRRRGPARGW